MHPFALGHVVSERAWADLGVAPVQDIWNTPDDQLHPVIVEFKRRCREGIQDNAVPLEAVQRQIDLYRRRARADPRSYQELPDVKVYRLRVDPKGGEAFRAAIFHDQQANIVWLLRVARISDFGSQDAEAKLYEQMGEYHANGELLPDDAELQAALHDQYLDAIVGALVRARHEAENDLDVWKAATVPTDATDVVVGDVYVHGEADDTGIYVLTVIVVLIDDPPPFARPATWRDAIKARAFDGDEAAAEDWTDLPADRPRRGAIVPFQQARIIDRDT